MAFELVTRQDQLGEVANAVDRAGAVGFDIETTSLRPWDGEIRLMSLKTPTTHHVVDLFKTGHPEAVIRALTDPKSKTVKVIQNAKFEQRWFLHKYGVEGELWPIFDPFRASNLIHNGRDLSHDLFSLQERELQVKPGEDLAASNWGGELTTTQLQYSADDTEYLLPLRESLKEKLARFGLNRVALIEFGAVLPESSIENNGFYLDRERWLALYEQNRITAKRLRQELSLELPHPRGQLALPGIEDGGGFNIGSTQQLQQSLARLGVEVTSTNKDVLGLLIPKIRKKAVKEILIKLIEYKKVKKLCESFGPDFLDNIDRKTGRIHSSFYPYTGAGRYSCSAPWTPVLTSVGVKPLEYVVPGDFVWTHKQRWRRVLAFLPQGKRAVFDVRFSDGQVLTSTADHRVLLSGGKWATIEEIQREYCQGMGRGSSQPEACEGPALYVGEGQPVRTIEAIYPRGSLEVYDLTVEEDESFETCGIFSHNCSHPNLQQIPRLKTFRECFTAAAGMSLGVWDYSQIELRIAADISGDARMIRAYHEGIDLHILTAALLNDIPIEEVTKAMRQPAKAGNFGLCIAEGQRVLTHLGLVPIEQVQDWHLVWDGVEWVHHEGVIFKGVKQVITYDGLTATTDHKVWTRDGRKVSLGQAASEGCELARTGAGVSPVAFGYLAPGAGDRAQPRWVRTCGRALSNMRKNIRAAFVEPAEREDAQMSVLARAQVSRSTGGNCGRALRRYGSALLSRYTQIIGSVQGAWDTGVVRVAGGLYSVGVGGVSDQRLHRVGFRQDGQQRTLLEREPSIGYAQCESAQSVRVYDLLNAGPRHRFTCEDRLVSNCYGMGAPKLAAYAQTNYGVSMDEAEAGQFRTKFFQGYSGLQRWHRKVFSDHNKSKGYTRTVSGRIRYLSPDKHSEFANTVVQGTGADGLKAALRLTYMELKKYGAKARMVNMVHDEIVAEASSEDPEMRKQMDLDVNQCMVAGMQQFLPTVPVVVEGGWGSSWADK